MTSAGERGGRTRAGAVARRPAAGSRAARRRRPAQRRRPLPLLARWRRSSPTSTRGGTRSTSRSRTGSTTCNIGAVVRNANAFLAAGVHIVGERRWNRRGAMVTDRYQHVCHHPTLEEFAAWAGAARRCRCWGSTTCRARWRSTRTSCRARCVLLFGQEGPGLSAEARALVGGGAGDPPVRLHPLDQRRGRFGRGDARVGQAVRAARLSRSVEQLAPARRRRGPRSPRARAPKQLRAQEREHRLLARPADADERRCPGAGASSRTVTIVSARPSTTPESGGPAVAALEALADDGLLEPERVEQLGPGAGDRARRPRRRRRSSTPPGRRSAPCTGAGRAAPPSSRPRRRRR